MITRGLSLVAVISFAASLGGCIDGVSDPGPEGTAGEDREAIINGTPATDFPEAVLVDIQRYGQTVMGCSGTLIAPRVVLTAGHCVADGDGWIVTAPHASGQKSHGSSSATYDWTQSNDQVSPDEHDVALVFLDSPITLASYPEIATAGLPDQAKVVTVGRVKGGQMSRTALYRSAPVAVRSAASYGFDYDYAAPMVIEHGDSGGASFALGSHTIVSVNSTGDSTTMLNARVDLLSDWIAKQIANPGGGGSPGGGGHPGGGNPGSPPGPNCAWNPWQQAYYCW